MIGESIKKKLIRESRKIFGRMIVCKKCKSSCTEDYKCLCNKLSMDTWRRSLINFLF